MSLDMPSSDSIPHVIHYCWFGGNPLPPEAVKCINSWRKFCPGYEIKLWNEDNFNLHMCPYIEEAYEAKKWAFVSDYARFWILYNYGGLYFDTDVEIIKPIDIIVNNGPFMGLEATGGIAPGLGLGAGIHEPLYKEVLEFYNNTHFKNLDGSNNEHTVVEYTTDILQKYGWDFKEDSEELKRFNSGEKPLEFAGIKIYPSQFFCPYNYETGELSITDKTISIHHYAATWHSKLDDIVTNVERCKSGKDSCEYKLRRMVSFPFRVANKIQKLGFKGTISFIDKKMH